MNGYDNSDLVDFIQVDLPAVLNYLAATAIMQNNDQSAKNYFLYRDTEGTGEWRILPWDLDLTFGLHFMTNDSILDDAIWADRIPIPARDGHPRGRLPLGGRQCGRLL